MDNVFVFVVIFAFFGVPLKYQYRVLFWGILGAIVMRLTFILVFGELLKRFEWIFYIFGAFLIYTGIKLATAHGVRDAPGPEHRAAAGPQVSARGPGLARRQFFVRQDGKLFVTSLFLVLLVVESTDVVFADRQRAGDLRHHERSVHRVHVERVRDHGPAGAVFPAGRRDGPVPLPELRPERDPDFHRRQDDAAPLVAAGAIGCRCW